VPTRLPAIRDDRLNDGAGALFDGRRGSPRHPIERRQAPNLWRCTVRSGHYAWAGFTFTSAPAFGSNIQYVANRDSVMIFLPYVANARDYRVYALVNGVTTIIAGNTEDVSGATISCAGLRQRNECDDAQAITDWGQGAFYVPHCSADVRAVDTPPTVLRQIELDNVTARTILAVEAIDTLCPFPGALGNQHVDVAISGSRVPVQATYQGAAGTFPLSQATFPIRTEAEIRASYSNSLIVNGEGPAPRPTDPTQGPFYNVAQPAPAITPTVLNRAIVSVTPTGTTSPPAGYKSTDIFDDFSDDTDAFNLIAARQNTEGVIVPAGFGPIGDVKQYANSKWNWYTFNGMAAQVYVARGQLNSVLADDGQDVMASNVLYPKRTIQLPGDDKTFIHITFETAADATQRRYWWLHLCGADQAGQTYSGTTFPPTEAIVAQPFFMNPNSGSQISLAGWNCFQFVPRGGDYDVLAGGDVHNAALGNNGRPETDIRMLVNRATSAGQNPLTDTTSVILLDPPTDTGDTQVLGGDWYRTWDATRRLNGVILDDQMFIQQKTRFDFFVNRSWAVMYANGVQKACDNFAAHPLTMAEAAVGFGVVFYHSSAERTELQLPDWIRTGQNNYLWNTPFVDVRSFDDVGIQEGVALPSSFDSTVCYTTPSN
jgi:hypothetical protein